MEFWIKAAQLILSLSILVVLHEFGHYIPARIFKTRVEKFYLFFNYKFSLFKKKIGETEWGIGWIPLGGYVKIAGMIDESMDKEQMKEPAKPWEFRSKPAWQRLIIMTGGVIVNLVLGMVIYVLILFAWGEERVDVNKLDHGMAVHPYMEQFGLQSGDNVIAVNGEEVYGPSDVTRDILLRGGRELTVKHIDGSTETVKLPESIDYNAFQKMGGSGLFGLRYTNKSVHKIAVSEAISSEKIPSESTIEKIDGKKLSAIDILDPEFRKKGHSVTFLNGEESTTHKLDAKEFHLLLWASPALSSGMLPGDEVMEINGTKIEFYDELSSELFSNKGKRVDLTVKRNGEMVNLTTRVTDDGKVGFAQDPESKIKYADQKAQYHVDYSFGASFGAGISRGYWTLHDYVSQMKFLFTKKGVTSMGGFGAIGGLFSPTWDWHSFWANTALISIILAFMNILPIPALDGGHVVFLLYEMITGREAPEKVLEIAQYIGFFLILGLVLFANGNDIYKALFGG